MEHMPDPDIKLGLSINRLMREVLIGQGLTYGDASACVDSFAHAFDAQVGTQWLEVNGSTEWRLSYDGRSTSQGPTMPPLSQGEATRLLAEMLDLDGEITTWAEYLEEESDDTELRTRMHVLVQASNLLIEYIQSRAKEQTT